MKSGDGLRGRAACCDYVGLVWEPVGAPQSRDSEKKQDWEKRDLEKQETETDLRDAGNAGKRAMARQERSRFRYCRL